jgi:predicted acylesterase/phospholipase RssA
LERKADFWVILRGTTPQKPNVAQSKANPDLKAERRKLEEERHKFRSSLSAETVREWTRHDQRIGVVLSGGGARGAYEAGVLLAFQDAQLPTHIIAATSIGSINAAFYAAHSETVVGNAEQAVEAWYDLTPTTVGIDWFRYILVLTGLTAVTAGLGNLFREWAWENGVYVQLTRPKWTWFSLFLTGVAVLFYYDKVSYLFHVLRNYAAKRRWVPDRRKVMESIVANATVWGCGVAFLMLAHIHVSTGEILDSSYDIFLAAAGCALMAAMGFVFRTQVSSFSHKFLRLPLRTGLFPNFERTRFLRSRIPLRGLMNSPIRVAMTAADVSTGSEVVFTNAKPEDLIHDRGVDGGFVMRETSHASDMLLGMIASSAFPIVYEAVPMRKGVYTDGGIVSNQPIRPAIRLGADVLFLVMVEAGEQKRTDIKTFLDLGIRAIDILTAQNLKSDLRMLKSVNSLCAQYAEELNVRAEQVRLHVGDRCYRYLKAFTIAPGEDLEAGVLDFDGTLTAPGVLRGYQDGVRRVRSFAAYLSNLPADMPARDVRLVAEKLAEDHHLRAKAAKTS